MVVWILYRLNAALRADWLEFYCFAPNYSHRNPLFGWFYWTFIASPPFFCAPTICNHQTNRCHIVKTSVPFKFDVFRMKCGCKYLLAALPFCYFFPNCSRLSWRLQKLPAKQTFWHAIVKKICWVFQQTCEMPLQRHDCTRRINWVQIFSGTLSCKESERRESARWYHRILWNRATIKCHP